MSLPTYDKTKRRKTFSILPKGAYVLRIMAAKEIENKNGAGTHLSIAFDIAEGEYAGFYQNQFDGNANEDKKWPNDAVYNLNVPSDNSPEYVWKNWNTFFADLEDSNNGFVFAGTVSSLKGKLIGGKFHNEQSEYRGTVYDHTRLKWTCIAEDVRKGKAGRMPADKLIGSASKPIETDSSGFMALSDAAEDELPF